MLKVSEHLKCKHIGWQETTPYCTLTNKYCGEKCLSFVNKYKEWENDRRRNENNAESK